MLAEEETTNEVDEAVLKSVVTGIEKGAARKFRKTRTRMISLTRPHQG